MELKIKPSKKNSYPLKGFLIKSALAKDWILELQNLGFRLQEIQVFPIPDTVANSIWGCLVLTDRKLKGNEVGQHQLCQSVFSNLFIPEKSIITPVISDSDKQLLFPKAVHVFHPEFGLVELVDSFHFGNLLETPKEQIADISAPESSVFIPMEIKSFYVKPVDAKDALENLEKNVFPKKEELSNKPLNLLEKGRLAFYRNLFKKSKTDDTESTEKTTLMERMDAFFKSVSTEENTWSKEMQGDFEDLEKRNQKQIDRFLEMLKNNPEEALKYAIPLDHNNSSRGGMYPGAFTLSKRWGNFSLFGGGGFSGGSGGGSIDLGDHFDTLNTQYNRTAEDLIRKKEYEKAAFIYMKLLKNYSLAAQTLENGKLYAEAAAVYLKYGNHKSKAAECYEKGKMTYEAIELYEELENFSKVGDLYLSLQKRKKANEFYEKTAQVFLDRNQYVQAAQVYQEKINDSIKTQRTLLEGWDKNMDGYNCLKRYFSNITDDKVLKNEYHFIYSKKMNNSNRQTFLKIVQHEFKKNNDSSEQLKNMGYEIIASQVEDYPNLIGELRVFNMEDTEVMKDISRYKIKNSGGR